MQLKAKKSLGQNFLFDKNIRAKIILACCLQKHDIVLEIGAGRGELTRSIAEAGVKKVYGIEIDKRLIPTLKDNLKDYANAEILHQDILKFDFCKFLKKNPVLQKNNTVKVIGNIPYYITTPIIERLLECRLSLKNIFLTVQKEFAQRAAAHPGNKIYGRFSCFMRYFTLPEILFLIKKNSFHPTPKVDSAFLKLEVLKVPSVKVKDEERFFKIIRASFNQRRKTLRKSLQEITSPAQLEKFFHLSGINPNARPEEFSLADFALLANI